MDNIVNYESKIHSFDSKNLKKASDLSTFSGKITCDRQVKLPASLRQNYLHHKQASCNQQVNYV